jgi:2-methylisocitrate lyase-like PEP mutase family enzyme
MTPEQKASRLLELHHGKEPLILVNAWDAGSAAVIEHAGLPAVATSSAGLANALGYADGQNVPWNAMLDVVRRITSVVQVPVSADIEAGFSANLAELDRAIEQLLEAGAVGINLEDALPEHADRGPLYPLAEQVARIQAARKAAEKQNIHLVINARVDAYWQSGVEPQKAMSNTLERGRAYLQAGADCIFVPGLKEPTQIRAVVDHFKSPVNILAVAGAPTIPEMARLGVKRVSFGGGPMRAVMGYLRRIAQEAKTSGTYGTVLESPVPSSEMNGFFRK